MSSTKNNNFIRIITQEAYSWSDIDKLSVDKYTLAGIAFIFI